MMKKSNYFVIGGQYASYCYGSRPTLLGAKRLANASREYFDNWQGWSRPRIYRAEDVQPVSNLCGEQIAPKPGAEPIEW